MADTKSYGWAGKILRVNLTTGSITTEPTAVCQALSDTFETGMTVLDARGGYSGADKTMIYFIVNRFQITRLRDLIHEIDPRAYITISEVADVYSVNHSGNGGSHE